MAKDFLGAEVEVGDKAVYVSTGRYAMRAIVEVVEIKTKVRIFVLKNDRGTYHDNDSFWADSGSLFVVEKFKSNKYPHFNK